MIALKMMVMIFIIIKRHRAENDCSAEVILRAFLRPMGWDVTGRRAHHGLVLVGSFGFGHNLGVVEAEDVVILHELVASLPSPQQLAHGALSHGKKPGTIKLRIFNQRSAVQSHPQITGIIYITAGRKWNADEHLSSRSFGALSGLKTNARLSTPSLPCDIAGIPLDSASSCTISLEDGTQTNQHPQQMHRGGARGL